MIKFIQRFYISIIFIILYTPIAIMILFSFNEGSSLSNFTGFSLRWYRDLLDNRAIMSALSNTVTIAVISTITATIVGTVAALGINSMKPVRRSLLMSFSNIPVLSPEIVTGVSLMMLFTFIMFPMGYMTMLIAHITFNIPYVILAVMPRLRGMNVSTYEAALDLGASPLKAFKDVIIPEIRPGIIAGMMIAFAMSIDDFVISYFTRGPGVSNLSIEIYNMRQGPRPNVNALSTIMFVVIVTLLLIVNIKQNLEVKKKNEENR